MVLVIKYCCRTSYSYRAVIYGVIHSDVIKITSWINSYDANTPVWKGGKAERLSMGTHSALTKTRKPIQIEAQYSTNTNRGLQAKLFILSLCKKTLKLAIKLANF